ncbi:hypothetical protein BJ742DRAFT_852577 [Cladochytrium replicatum]|nr:hypothetical protein BJ742DRAFT_852577 [Cladochytrium replicatum]
MSDGSLTQISASGSATTVFAPPDLPSEIPSSSSDSTAPAAEPPSSAAPRTAEDSSNNSPETQQRALRSRRRRLLRLRRRRRRMLMEEGGPGVPPGGAGEFVSYHPETQELLVREKQSAKFAAAYIAIGYSVVHFVAVMSSMSVFGAVSCDNLLEWYLVISTALVALTAPKRSILIYVDGLRGQYPVLKFMEILWLLGATASFCWSIVGASFLARTETYCRMESPTLYYLTMGELISRIVMFIVNPLYLDHYHFWRTTFCFPSPEYVEAFAEDQIQARLALGFMTPPFSPINDDQGGLSKSELDELKLFQFEKPSKCTTAMGPKVTIVMTAADIYEPAIPAQIPKTPLPALLHHRQLAVEESTVQASRRLNTLTWSPVASLRQLYTMESAEKVRASEDSSAVDLSTAHSASQSLAPVDLLPISGSAYTRSQSMCHLPAASRASLSARSATSVPISRGSTDRPRPLILDHYRRQHRPTLVAVPPPDEEEELEEEMEEEDVCAICVCEFEEGEWCRELGCGHVFHSECVDGWLLGEQGRRRGHRRCPLCGRDATVRWERPNAEARVESA